MRRYSQGQGKALPYGIDSDPPKDALEGGPGADGKSGGPVKGVSLLLSVFNLTNTAIGAGVLSLPFFFASTGVVIGELASYSSIIPFIHPVYTFIAVYAPMYTRYIFASTGGHRYANPSYSIPVIHPLYSPFIHTCITICTPMHTRYTCIYTMYTPLNP